MEGINSDERYFEGLLTVQMKDKQGEVTIVDELYKVLPVWIDRGAPISDTHSNRIVGKGINYSRTTVKGDDGGELPAIKITGKIFKNYELDNVIWEKIKNNEYKGLSFGGATRSARSPIKMKDGSTAYALSDLEHYEVAVCKDPAVPMAIITDFNQIAKANFDSTVRDDGKMVIQCSNMSCMVKKDDEEDEEFYHDEEGDVRNDIEKFMEKKEMFEAVTDNPEEDTKAKITKGDGSTNTEDRNNRSDLNDLVRDKRQFNGTKGTLSEELPNMTIANPIKNGKNAADLNESQTFEQKVQALIREGKSRESAEKIVGSFVHKEAAGGNGMGGGANSSGSGGMSGGGTLTTDSGGTNNPVHNNGCDCTCKDCERNDKCDCCEKCKRKSKGLDISNTNSVGTSSAYNQDAPNGSRLNNKADDIDLDKIIEQETENVKGKKGGGGHRSLATRLTSRQNAKKKATREVNKVHALMKLNKVKTQLGGFAEESAQARIRDQSSNTTPKPRTGNAPIKGDSQGTWNERNYPNRIDDAKLTPSSESTSYAANDDHERERTYNQGTKQLPKGGKSPKDLGKTSSFKKPAAPKMNSRGGRILDPSGSDDRSFGEIRDQEGTIRDADEPSPKRTIKSLEALTKEMIGVGTGIRGGGSSYAHTQGQGNSTQVTIVPPRPEDDRVASKKVKNRKE
jgi:hypothetical protein